MKIGVKRVDDEVIGIISLDFIVYKVVYCGMLYVENTHRIIGCKGFPYWLISTFWPAIWCCSHSVYTVLLLDSITNRIVLEWKDH
jgi:hypothetical protein